MAETKILSNYCTEGDVFLKMVKNNLFNQYLQKSAKITKTRHGVRGVVFPKIVENNLFYQGLQNQHQLQKRRLVSMGFGASFF